MKKNLATVLFVVAMFAVPSVRAQDKFADVTDMQALRAAVQADRKAVVASTLNLTPAEAKKFWPLYDAYQRALDRSNRQRAVALEGAIARDRPASDLYAKNLTNDLIEADEIEVRARRTLGNRALRALPAKKAARYVQLETKIRAYQAYDIATTFPLIK